MAAIVTEATEATRRAFDAQNLDRVTSADSLSDYPGEGHDSSSGMQAAPRGVTEMEAIAIRQRRARFRDHCDKWAGAIYDSAIKVKVKVPLALLFHHVLLDTEAIPMLFS